MRFTFFSDIVKYWEVFCDYINPYSILIWGIVGAIIGCITTLLVIIVFREKILIPRKYVLLKILSYCYMVLLPLFVGFCALQWSVIHNCESQIIRNIPSYMGGSAKIFNRYIKSETKKIMGLENLNSTVNDLPDSVINSMKSEKTGMSDALFVYISSVLVESDFVKNYIVTEINKKKDTMLLTDNIITDDFIDNEIGKIMDNGIINTLVEKNIKSITGGLKINIWLLFLLGMALPVIEIIVANKTHKPDLDNSKPL